MPEEGLSLDDFDLDIESSPKKKEGRQSEQELPQNTPRTHEESKIFVQNSLKLLYKNWERVVAILNNVKNSRVFDIPDELSENKNIMHNLQRDFENVILRGVEELEKLYKELTATPRSVQSYTLNYTRAQKDILHPLAEKEKMESIFAWEMQNEFLGLLNRFGKMVTELLQLMNQKGTPSVLKSLEYHQQRMFDDARNSCLFCMGEMDSLRRNIEKWQDVNR